MGFTPEKAGARVAFDGGKSRPAPQTNEPVRATTLDEITELAIGEKCALLGVTMRGGRKAEKYVAYSVGHDATEDTVIDVMIWTTNPPPAWAVHGARVSFPEVEVREYRGNRQYVATEIKEVMTQ